MGKTETETNHAAVLTEAMSWKRDDSEAQNRLENSRGLKTKNGTPDVVGAPLEKKSKIADLTPSSEVPSFSLRP